MALTRHTQLRRTPIRKRRKPRRGRVLDPQYLSWIRTLPCLICGATSEAAHVGERGYGQKADDSTAIPLCPAHHREGREAQHVMGRRFWGHHKLDRDSIIAELNAQYEQTMRATDAMNRRGVGKCGI